MAITFGDTKKLEKALGEEAAGVIVKIFEARDAAIRKNLAAEHDITVVQTDITLLKADVDAQLAKTKASLITWVAGMLVAQSVIIATLVKLLAK